MKRDSWRLSTNFWLLSLGCYELWGERWFAWAKSSREHCRMGEQLWATSLSKSWRVHTNLIFLAWHFVSSVWVREICFGVFMDFWWSCRLWMETHATSPLSIHVIFWTWNILGLYRHFFLISYVFVVCYEAMILDVYTASSGMGFGSVGGLKLHWRQFSSFELFTLLHNEESLDAAIFLCFSSCLNGSDQFVCLFFCALILFDCSSGRDICLQAFACYPFSRSYDNFPSSQAFLSRFWLDGYASNLFMNRGHILFSILTISALQSSQLQRVHGSASAPGCW